jgi:hypothetical protein
MGMPRQHPWILLVGTVLETGSIVDDTDLHEMRILLAEMVNQLSYALFFARFSWQQLHGILQKDS